MIRTHGRVPCKWCGALTFMTATKECDAHWELRHRIEGEPEMAARMLSELTTPQNEDEQEPQDRDDYAAGSDGW